MSSDRNHGKPLKPTIAAVRISRSPLTPRIAGNAPTSTPTGRTAAQRPVSARTPLVSPRTNTQNDTTSSLNITPRSTARRSRNGISPSQSDRPGSTGAKSSLGCDLSSKIGDDDGLAVGNNGISLSTQNTGQTKSIRSDRSCESAPPMAAAGLIDMPSPSGQADIESRFFHASDMLKQEATAKRPEPKKLPSFFYADEREDPPTHSPKPSSPGLPLLSDKRSSGPWNSSSSNLSKYAPMRSPTLAAATTSAPFFASTTYTQAPLRSPSPSKENIHLSYRKGASQIFGMRPPLSSTTSVEGIPRIPEDPSLSQRPDTAPSHRKSTSMSSIDSGQSRQSRRRSSTGLDQLAPGVTAPQDMKAVARPLLPTPTGGLPSIDTSLASPALVGSPSAFSPTKPNSELAADARRERKVLDLEISNNSLLAINSSLEREVRKQKAELKRFRRLSRAGYFSMSAGEVSSRRSHGLYSLEEGNESGEEDFHDGDFQDDYSDSEEGSLVSGSDSLASEGHAARERDRLVKDEKRLRIDLERHKELLAQSQSVNQSIKRCMYATEEMIREGRNALAYHLRVDDVKLGGRVLTGDDDEYANGDTYTEVGDVSMEGAKGLLDVWYGVGAGEGSEGSGDRDSGIEVDKTILAVPTQPRVRTGSVQLEDSRRPPGDTSGRLVSQDSLRRNLEIGTRPG